MSLISLGKKAEIYGHEYVRNFQELVGIKAKPDKPQSMDGVYIDNATVLKLIHITYGLDSNTNQIWLNGISFQAQGDNREEYLYQKPSLNSWPTEDWNNITVYDGDGQGNFDTTKTMTLHQYVSKLAGGVYSYPINQLEVA